MATTKGGADSAVLPPHIALGPRIPQGLAMAVEGLTREVLRNRPEDIYVFAAHHFEKLLQLRERHRFGLPATDKVTQGSRLETSEVETGSRPRQRTRSRNRSGKSGWSLSETAKVLERHRRIFGENETRISTEDVRALAHSRNEDWTVTTTVTTTMTTTTTTTTTTTVAPVSHVSHREPRQSSSGRERSGSRRRKTSSDRAAAKFVDLVANVERDIRSLARLPSTGEVSGSQSSKRRAVRERNQLEKNVKETHGDGSKHAASIRVSRRRRGAPENVEAKDKTSEVRCSVAPRMDRVKDYVVRTFASNRSLEELQSAKYVEKVQDVIDKTAPIIRNKLEELKSATRGSRQIDIYADGGRGAGNESGNGVSDSSRGSSASDEEVIDNVENIESKKVVDDEKNPAATNDDAPSTNSHLLVRRSSSCKDIRVGNNGGQQEVGKVSLPVVRPRSSKNGRAASKNESDHTVDQLILPPISPDALKCPKRKDDLTLPMLPIAGNVSASSPSSFVVADGSGKEERAESAEKRSESKNDDEGNGDGNAKTDRSDAVVDEVFRDSLNVTPEVLELSQRPDSLEMERVDEVEDGGAVAGSTEEDAETGKADGLVNKLRELEVAERSVERILSLSAATKKSSDEAVAADKVEGAQEEKDGKNDNTIRRKLREVEETERRIGEILVGTEKSTSQLVSGTKDEKVSRTAHSTKNNDDEASFCYILTEGSPCEIPESVTTVIIPDRQFVSPESEPDLDTQHPESLEQLETSAAVDEEHDDPSKQNGAFGEYIRPDTGHAYDDVDCIRGMKLSHDLSISHQDLDRIKEEEEDEEEESHENKMADKEEEKQESPKDQQGEDEEQEKKDIEDKIPVHSSSLLEDIPEHEEKETSIPGDVKELNDGHDVERSIDERVAENAELGSSESSNEQKDATVTDHSTTDSLSPDPSRPIVPELNLDSLQDMTVSSLKPLTDNTDETMDDVENNGHENDNDASLQSCSLHISSRRSDESHATIEHRANDVSSGGIKSSSDAEEVVKESPSESAFVFGDSPIEIQDLQVEKGEAEAEEKKSDDIEEEIAKELIEIDRSENRRTSMSQERKGSLKEGVDGSNELSESSSDVAPTKEVRDLIREFVITEEIGGPLPIAQKSEDNDTNKEDNGESSMEIENEGSPKVGSCGTENRSQSAEQKSDNEEISPVEERKVEENISSSRKNSSPVNSLNAVSEEKDEEKSKEEEQNSSSERSKRKSVDRGSEEDDKEQAKKNGESSTDTGNSSIHDLSETANKVQEIKAENESERSSEIAGVGGNDSRISDIEHNDESRQNSGEKGDDSPGSFKGGSGKEAGSTKSDMEDSDISKHSVDESVGEDVAVATSTAVEPTIDEYTAAEPAGNECSGFEHTNGESSVAEPAIDESTIVEPAIDKSTAVEAAVDESRSIKPTVQESIVAKPMTDESTVVEPTTDESAAAEAAANEFSGVDHTNGESSVAEPAVDESTIVEPTVHESIAVEPTTDESRAVQASVDEPSVAESTTAEPSIAESSVAESPPAEPSVAESGVDKPTVNETAADDPTVHKPIVDESTSSNPPISEPSVDKSSTDDPSPNESCPDEPSIEKSTTSSDNSTQTAATRIQAGVRGFLTRRRLRSVRQIGASTLDSIPSIQDNVTMDPEASVPEPDRSRLDEIHRESKIRQQRLRREDAVQRKTLSLENAFAADGVQHTGEFHDCLPLPIFMPIRPRSEDNGSSQDISNVSPTDSSTTTSIESPSVPTTPNGLFTRTSNIPEAVDQVLDHHIGINAEQIVDLLVLQLATAAEETNLQNHYLNFITSVEDTCDDPTPVTTADFRSTGSKEEDVSSQVEGTRDRSLREPLALPGSPRGVLIEEIGTSLEPTVDDEGKNGLDSGGDGANVPDNGSEPTGDHEKQAAP